MRQFSMYRVHPPPRPGLTAAVSSPRLAAWLPPAPRRLDAPCNVADNPLMETLMRSSTSRQARHRSPLRVTLAFGLLATISFRTAPPLAAQGFGATQEATEKIDSVAVKKIKAEGFGHSQVMDIMSWLTDVYGPRLTGSPITKKAGDWTIGQFKAWGLANPHYEMWGPFGRGWVNDKTYVQVTAPVAFPVIAYPGAWSDGTNGLVSSDVILVPSTIGTPAQFAPFRGKLKGKIVVSQAPTPTPALFNAPGHRYTKEELDAMSNPYPLPSGRGRGRGGFGGRGGASQIDLNACFQAEGVAAVLRPGSGNSTGGNVFVSAAGSREANAPHAVPLLSLTPEHYGRIYRILEKGLPVRMEVDVRNTFYNNDLNSFNIVAEIPGTDKADEVVMVGAHFDSWQAGTGATDNAAGSAVMMEAMRILRTIGMPMRRTVRIGLWTGEEQGLLGSREYVTAHFGDRTTMQMKPEHAKFDAYYNVDNGTGAIRGIYLQGNNAVGPIFSEWMRVLNSDSISVGYIDPGNTGGTDHQSFDAVGLPGFQFIQDPIEYGTRTHHSSQDVYERIQDVDMKHNAVAVATFLYLTANRDDPLPRKPLPDNAGGRGGFGGRGGNAPVGCPSS
jgi:carboxypeptidase Q